jgi:anti-anti-sigma factor
MSTPAPASGAPVSDEGLPEVDERLADDAYVPDWESLKIEATTVGDAGDIVVVSLRGIIDTVSAENLRAALGNVVGRGINKIVVDMSGVEYVSSGGWGTFTERLREVRRDGGDIKLFGMDQDVYYVFTMLGFNIVLSSFDILTQAIDDFEAGESTKADPEVMTGQPAPQLEAEPDRTPEPELVVDDVLTDGGVEISEPAPEPELTVDDVLLNEFPDTDATVSEPERIVDDLPVSETTDTPLVDDPVADDTLTAETEDIVLPDEPMVDDTVMAEAEDVLETEEPVVDNLVTAETEDVVVPDEPMVDDTLTAEAGDVLEADEPMVDDTVMAETEDVVVPDEPMVDDRHGDG